MTIDEQIKILESNSEFERKEGDLQGCLNFKQLAEWLKDYKRLKEQEPCDDCIRRSDIGLTDFEIVMCNGDYKEGLKMLLDKIKKAPSVTPMPCGDCISRKSVSGCVSAMYYKGLGKQKSLEYILKYVERLPSVSPQPCEDCISRQQAIDKMQELEEEDIEAYGCSIPEGFDGKRAIEALKALSSVHPKPKVGQWIVHPKGIYAHLVCDKCLSNAPYDCRTNYCPSCGAKMQEVKA